MHRLQHGGRAAVGIHSTVCPGVAVVACDHPLVRTVRPTNLPNDVPNSAEGVILLQVHLDSHWPRSYVIGEGQGALPVSRRLRPVQVGQYGLSIGIGERRGGNPRQRL